MSVLTYIMKGIGAVDSGSDIIKSCNKRGAVTLEKKKQLFIQVQPEFNEK